MVVVSNPDPVISETYTEQAVARQPVISISTSFLSPLNRAGGRTFDVR
jgi:hypothetical protein